MASSKATVVVKEVILTMTEEESKALTLFLGQTSRADASLKGLLTGVYNALTQTKYIRQEEV